MADKIQNAYEASKDIYDDVLTQGNVFSRMYIKLFGAARMTRSSRETSYPISPTTFPESFWMSRSERLCSRNANGHP